MFKFKWSTALVNEMADSILQCVGIKRPEHRTHVRKQILTILANESGFLVRKDKSDKDKARAIAYGLLEDALRRSFPTKLRQLHWPGVEIRKASDGIHSRAIARNRIAINVATTDSLESLPGIGSNLARMIVCARRKCGPFRDRRDLARRLNGVGPERSHRIDGLIHYRIAAECEHPDDGVLGILPHLFHTREKKQEEQLIELLETTAVTSARRSAEQWFDFRMHESRMPETPLVASKLEILQGSQYYVRMRELLHKARSSIFVSMFHIAFPKERHPTKDLLDALVKAHKNGIKVRVLLDRDRPKDPYGSVVINRNAVRYLVKGGVPVRLDSPDNLLHSKVVLVDKKTIVIGSHNWSAGSYYRFGDLSVALESTDAAKTMVSRFRDMWAEASSP